MAKALALEGWSFTDVEVVATGGAPGRAPERRAPAPGPTSWACRCALSLTHTETTAGAVALAL